MHILLKLYHIILHFLNFICYVMLYYSFSFNLFKLTVCSQYDIVKFILIDICSGIPLGDIKFDSHPPAPGVLHVVCETGAWEAEDTHTQVLVSSHLVVSMYPASGCHRDGGICGLFYYVD